MNDLRDQLQATLSGTYSIERELGGGGMSRVFVAHDEALGRDVVIKVIAPESAEGLSADRFAREVKLAARLQQANIVPVLAAGMSAGLPYYTMPFVRGESLRARLATTPALTPAECVSILRDVARALAYAHAEGVVHRDIKPENILLSGGAAVVTDFGIAKAIDASRTQDGGHHSTITRAGTSLGTPAYMAPEQALGDPSTDARADIYAWGVMAWELLAGEHPFAHHRAMQAVVAAHITEPVRSLAAVRPGLPATLNQLVMRCLEKRPEDRPATAGELLSALEAVNLSGDNALPARPRRSFPAKYVAAAFVAVVVIGAIAMFARERRPSLAIADKSLAVIPFLATADTANSYLGEGIAEEVTNRLAQIPGLRLAGRTSAARVAQSRGAPQDMAKTLGVSSVLDGTVRRVGSRVRVTVELTGPSGGVIWHESYDRDAKDVAAMQDDIARAIAGQLQVTLSESSAGRSDGTRDATAHDLYLKGTYLYRRRSSAAMLESVSALEQATTRDTTYARAWAAFASALIAASNYTGATLASVMPRARAAAERAVRLDSTLSEAHLALGYAYAESFAWVNAEKELRRAIALDTTAVEPLYRLGYMLVNMGRSAEAIPILQQARARDPMYFLAPVYLGIARLQMGSVLEGLTDIQHAAELEPTSAPTLTALARGYLLAGMRDSSIAVARRQYKSPLPGHWGVAASILAMNGERAEALAIVKRLEALPPETWTRTGGLAIAYLGLGDYAHAEPMMERAAAADGDLFVLFCVVTCETPRDARSDAVWRKLGLDPALRPRSRK